MKKFFTWDNKGFRVSLIILGVVLLTLGGIFIYSKTVSKPDLEKEVTLSESIKISNPSLETKDGLTRYRAMLTVSEDQDINMIYVTFKKEAKEIVTLKCPVGKTMETDDQFELDCSTDADLSDYTEVLYSSN